MCCVYRERGRVNGEGGGSLSFSVSQNALNLQSLNTASRLLPPTPRPRARPSKHSPVILNQKKTRFALSRRLCVARKLRTQFNYEGGL